MEVQRSRLYKKGGLLSGVFVTTLCAFYVYASIDTTEYVVESMKILPEAVEGPQWENIEQAMIQDLLDDSLSQEFSNSNASSLPFDDLTGTRAIDSVDSSTTVEEFYETALEETQSDTPENAPDNTGVPSIVPVTDDETEDGRSDNASIEESVDTPVELNQEPLQNSAESEPEPNVDTSSTHSTRSFARVTDGVRYAYTSFISQLFAVDDTTVPIPTLPLELDSAYVTEPETSDDPVVAPDNFEDTTFESEIETDAVEESVPNDPVEGQVSGEEEASSSGDVSDYTEPAATIDTTLTRSVPPDALLQPSTATPCEVAEGCQTYPIQFSEFGVLELDHSTVIENAQIRLSLAARPSGNTASGVHRARVQYTFGTAWIDAGIIDLRDEVSNSINGGYYLYALPQIDDARWFESFAVRVLFEGDPEAMDEFYLDAVWLELEAGSLYEPADAEENLDTISYIRDLQEPVINEFIDPPDDFMLGVDLNFNLKYHSQENIFERFFENLTGRLTYVVDHITITHERYGPVEVPFEVTYHEDGTWTLSSLALPQKLHPGKYSISVAITEDGEVYNDSFEFYWGVLAVNTEKTMYHQNEPVTLHMAALTDKGDTICDADLRLNIVDPDHDIYEIPVTESGACGPNNVTDIPDYLATFVDTDEFGSYQIVLSHYNTEGTLVHKIVDAFEVREYIPYDIVRTGPTRIYPPAAYGVSFTITAHRTFEGNIVERVPLGFVLSGYEEGAEVRSLPDHLELVWHDVALAEGEERTFSYTFDAPDVSPYLYILGPLDMDGFQELRAWQIASDALGAVAWLTGTQTANGTDLNATAARMLWSTSTIDDLYFIHSTSSESYKLTVRQAGDYLLGLTLPQQRTDANSSRTRIGAEVRVNGTAVPTGLARSGYIRNANSHSESSSHVTVMLDGLSEDDYIEVYVEGLTTIDASDNVIVSGQAGLYVEYIDPGETIFAATTTRSVASTSFNGAASELEWAEVRQDTGFVHSDSVNPQDIVIDNAGTYIVFVNLPFNGNAAQMNVLGRVLLDGNQVQGGVFAQGYQQSNANESDGNSSIHWSGIVIATTTDQVLSISVEREAVAGSAVVPTGFVGSIYVQKLPSSDVIVLRGNDLSGGTDWSDTPAESILWDTQDVIDTNTFTHSTVSNSDDIIVDADGDYLLVYNDAQTSATARANTRVTVTVDGTAVSGAQTKSHYIRNQSGHTDSSGSLTFLLEGVTAGQTINVLSEQEANAATVNDTVDAIVMLWKKAELNLRPETYTYYDTPFDSINYSSTTPHFDFSTVDPDGSASIEYEISWSTSTDFIASTTKRSGVDAGFVNTVSSGDTSPFTEGNRIRYQIQSADTFEYDTTYYWRIRAKDAGGSDNYGEWSTTQSLTIREGIEIPRWLQTESGQFETDTLVNAAVNSSGGVAVDVPANEEAMIFYGESGNNTLKYRVWNGDTIGSEQSAISVGGVPNWVVSTAGTTRDEYIVGTLDASNDTNFIVLNNASSSWGNLLELSTTVSNAARRGIGVAYETLSGDAIAVSCDGDADPSYSVWDGSSWSGSPGTINLNSANNCEVITMASNPTSDEIMLIARDTGGQYEAQVWNGTGWGDSQILGSMQAGDEVKEGLAVAYEASGDQAIVISTNGFANSFIWNSWDGFDWGTNAAQATGGNDFENGRLVADEGTDRMVLCYIDDSAVIRAQIWDGDGWESTGTSLTGTGNDDRGRAVDCVFETMSGRDGYILAGYSDTGVDGDYHAVHNGSSWTTNQTGSDITDSFWVQLGRTGDGTVLAVHLDDENDDVDFTSWNGTSWANHTTLEDTPTSITLPTYEMASIAAKRYVSEAGTISTGPINHSAIPDQPTWGDIYFSTTEGVGTDISVQVYYTSSLTCDTLVPDGDLTGNATGFDAIDSPIDISGLATTTYGEICLHATLTQNAGTSPTLDEWSVTWERAPFLAQNYFRWYVNGSYLTPTDVWPVGPASLAENAAITANESIDGNERIRLRMSLLDDNVPFATSSDQFKLQYAEANDCFVANEWFDVGDPSSTTTQWRGYENAIVGDDWYNGSWGRRIALTVDSGLVGTDVTDFPVYVDLADLPSGFFQNVQSDGDDIRITESDGVTELPYDLVSLSTGGETGELHFKANLSSTTNATFYLYYGNASASGYGASATYGSQNVWTNGYSLRYAMDDNPAGSSPQFLDSTANSNDAVARAGMTSGDVVVGVLGNAINHDGNDGGVFQTPLSYTGPFTISLWWRSQVVADGDGFAVAGPAGAFEKFGTWTSGNFFARVISSSDNASAAPADGSWSHVVLTRDSSDKIDVYRDAGTPARLFGNVAQSGSSDWENFGGETSQGFEGDIDELRFANVARSAGWIETEFNNQSNPTGFYGVSGEELISDGRALPSTVLSVSDIPETYEEQNPTVSNPHGIEVGDDAEWDFVLENYNATSSTEYCFRMVYADGGLLDDYLYYPSLVTNAPPEAPSLSSPFDNEKVASTTPFFDFTTDDAAGDDVSYQIQVDDDYAFDSTAIDRNSVDHFSQFENIVTPADKDPFTSGQTVRFIHTSGLTSGTTYWWRVRGLDPSGSGEWGDWSTPQSFTVDNTITATTWFQTTSEQFDTDTLEDAETNASGDDVRIISSFTYGTTTSTAIDFDDGAPSFGNAWGELSFTDLETSSDIKYSIEYLVSGSTWELVPEAVLPGNAAGFDASPVSLITLDTETYNTIRLRADLDDNGATPRLQDWTISWGYRVEMPTLSNPFDNAKVATTTPSFAFTTIDPEGQDLEYEFSFSETPDFTASTTYRSNTAGFSNVTTPADTHPFNSGDVVRYTLQAADALTSSSTYWWRVRARDPGGSNTFSDWSLSQSLTVDESIVTSVWYQTTGEQFDTSTLTDMEGNSTLDQAEITTTLREAMVAYGEGSVQSPRYRLWDGTVWGDEQSAESVGAQIEWIVVRPSPTRNEYAMGTLGTDADVNVQIYNGDDDSWGDRTELVTAVADTNLRAYDLAYESDSGDLISVACYGTDATYSIWNGSSWTATSTIDLGNTNNCLWVKLASDPTSDEIMLVVRHSNAGAIDYEAQVWNGSAWGNPTRFGNMSENAHEGIAVEYEESGNQAVVAVSNDANPSFIYKAWTGSWGATTTQALDDDFEWGVISRDDGTDDMALCYIDQDAALGIVRWDGTTFEPFQEFETLGNARQGRPVTCQFETVGARDGTIMIPYSDNGAAGAGDGGKYQTTEVGTTTFSGELDIGNVEDSYNVTSVRTADGLILAVFFDDTADDYVFTYWDGSSWDTESVLHTSPSVTGTPFNESLGLASRIYPAFTSGTMQSDVVDFDDGTGPRWESVRFSDTTPGSSSIVYQVYYVTATGTIARIPDSALAGNSTGFTISPIDISGLNRVTYNELVLKADLTCAAGLCPTVQDWSIEWAEGIDVSGIAYQYDGTTPMTSGTVAVAVDGVLQPGKTGTIAGDGTWTIDNVTAFEGDTVTVFIDGAVDADEAVGISSYDGIGDMSGYTLSARHLTIGSDVGSATTTNTAISLYDYTNDEDLFFDVNGSNALTLCADAGCTDARLKILDNGIYQPGNGSITVHDFQNEGVFLPSGNTLRVSGSWIDNGSTTIATSTVVFTATSGSESITTASSTLHFYGLTFGEGSGSATWSISDPLNVDGVFTTNYGTLARATTSITVAGNLAFGSSGQWSGMGTTTFDGTGSATWSDATALGVNIGRGVIDGTSKTVTLSSDVKAQSIMIGADDVLNAGGTRDIEVLTSWTNLNTFVPSTGSVTFTGSTTQTIANNTSTFYNLSFNGPGSLWSFTTSNVTINNNLSIASGTLTMPTGTTTIKGSFTNTGGVFGHNNGTVHFNATASGKTIALQGTEFLNAFYNVVFSGSGGGWTFTDTRATTTHDFRITQGTVTLPSGQLTVGGAFTTTGSGTFNHNNGELVLQVNDSDSLQVNSSSLNNVRVRTGSTPAGWYHDSWPYRIPITIDADVVDDDLTNFPVYLDLDDLASHFFSNVRSDGGDIRITTSDGTTEVPREIVSISVGSTVGEVHFLAPALSSTTDTTFFVYYGNSSATDHADTDAYGAEKVWKNGYRLVEHFDDLTTGTVLNSRTSSLNGTKTSANNPIENASGKIYEAQSFDGTSDYISHGDIPASSSNFSFSGWFKADDLTGSGDTATYGFSLFGISPSGAPYTWLTVGGTGYTTEARLCAWSNSATCTGTSGAGIGTGAWHFIAVSATDGGATTVRVDGSQVLSYTNAGDGSLGTNFTVGDLRPTRNIDFDGLMDEFRFATTTRSNAWQDATYRNQATTTNFYDISTYETPDSRTFDTTNITILGNLIIETGASASLPSGVLSIGGSLDNNGEFDARSGTVRFNSSAGSETIAAGNSSFATLDFNAAMGNFTITEHATATIGITLSNATAWTLNSGIVLESMGAFTNAMSGAATTWTGSTLRLSSGSSIALNSKTASGDVYETLLLANDTKASMWNSSATTYVTPGSASLYSQDHAGSDGDLSIFGVYTKTNGTEHWSYATDFDGTALAGLSRQVDVRIANGATVILSNSTLSVLGSATASTTIDNQGSGTYTLSVVNGTSTMQYYEFSNLGSTGLTLDGDTVMTLMDNGAFIPGIAGGSGLTISSSTIDANPGMQIEQVRFSTTSALSAFNVTQTGGTPASYWWFRNSTGNLDGEAYDSDTGNPGSVRWDDSSLSVSISGTVYADAGVTPLGAPTCDSGVTTPVRVVVEGGSSYTGTCNSVDGSYLISGVTIVGDPIVTVYLDGAAGGHKASVITKTLTADVTDMDLYVNRVMVRHEDVSALTIEDMAAYDSGDDSDLMFTVATGTIDTLTTLPDTELYVFASHTFAPGGDIVLGSGGSGTSFDGTLALGAGSSFVGMATSSYTIGGSLIQGTGATMSLASSTVTMVATTTGKAITATSNEAINFYALVFNGIGGSWNLNADINVATDLDLSAGTLTGTGDITITDGSFSGNGTLSLGSGTTTIARTNTLGGTQPWAFGSLILGNGSTIGTTTPAGTATTTINGQLRIATAHFLDAGSSHFDIRGTGTAFVEQGTFREGTSVIRYSGTGTTTILSTVYYDLVLDGVAGTPRYRAIGTGIRTLDDLVVGGETTTRADFNTNDTTLQVDGDVLIASNGVFEASNSGTFTILGSFDNNGTFTANGGTVSFESSGSSTIAPGLSAFGSLTIDGTGSFTITESATSSVAFALVNASSFTQNSGTTLAVGGTFSNGIGGAVTTWTGSILSLYGGSNYEINTKSISDSYATLTIGANTDIRMWNSDAMNYSVDPSGSLYSQDHAGSDGDLYIFGSYPGNGSTDHWSYATDFDGVLLGGSSRQVDVRFASGASMSMVSGGLSVIGSPTASTTFSNQGSGTYGMRIGGNASTSWRYYDIENIDASGLVFSGTPHVTTLSYGDFLVGIAGGSAITVGGSVINTNPARTFTGDVFATSTAISAYNVTATGTAVSSWRFTNHEGNIDGEAFDNDPDGDPGYIVWSDSAASITISGHVYSDEGSTVSTACDGSPANVHLRVAGLTSYTGSCDTLTGAYSIPFVTYSPGDSLVVYIDGETPKAATVTEDPVSNITNMDLYENRVIVRHEDTDSLSIADMTSWDSSDDADIPFTAIDGSPDTLNLPSGMKLLIWNGKEFEPLGNVTLSGDGTGGAHDGTLEAQTNAALTFSAGETHALGGSLIMGTSAVFTGSTATTTFTTTATNRTIDVNEDAFGNMSFTGSGSWTVTDPTMSVQNVLLSGGVLTLPTGTTTVSKNWNATTGSFVYNGGSFVFTGGGTGKIVRGNGSTFGPLSFNQSGATWSMTDTNATSTGSVIVTAGSVTLPSGAFAVGGDLRDDGGTFVHNTSLLVLTSTSTAVVRAGGSDLYGVLVQGEGTFSFADTDLSILDDLLLSAGTTTLATGTMSIGGSLIASGGSFDHASGTVLMNSTDSGETVNPGANVLYNIVFSGVGGGWTITGNATTTNNFTITTGSSFTVQSGVHVAVGSVFTNTLGGSATTWTGSTLRLFGDEPFTINTKVAGGDRYETLSIADGLAIRMWNSVATTTYTGISASLYSQDHTATDGSLFIYGDLTIATSSEYWSYATDFDGTVLSGGSRRAVSVRMAPYATTTVSGGSLAIIGGANATTTIATQSAGSYTMLIAEGTFSASHYSFADLDATGLTFTGTPSLSNLSYGYFERALDASSLITLASTTLNANPGVTWTSVGFDGNGFTGYNVTLLGTTSNAWRFSASYGTQDGELFDSDGATDCGSIRWDDSSCLLVEQTHYRWRNDDGGEGAPNSEWFDADWGYRKRIRVLNNDATTYTDAPVKLDVAFDLDMQTDFEDLRFTDASGTTTIPYWIERYTASTDADVWVQIPTLPSGDSAVVYMYYDNALATSTSDSSATFVSADDFEDNNITEYSGDTSLFTTGASPVYGGSYALEAANTSGKTTDGIYRTDLSVSQGETIRYMQYIDTSAGTFDETCTLFGVQSPGSDNDNYAVCLELYGADRISLAKDVTNSDSSGTVLATSSVSYTTGWYEVQIDWGTDDDIDVALYTSAGSLVATTSATDSTYTTGGIGFAFWFQNGAWDSYVSYPTITTNPTILVGQEQGSNGATWNSGIDTVSASVEPNDTVRLRFAIENSGLDISGQHFTLEYAEKGSAPSCGSVSSGDYTVAPNQASCGTSPICLQTSANLTDGEATTDHLSGTEGAFVPGFVLESPSTSTPALAIDQGEYTEVEYALSPTLYATGNYCLRVTDEGDELDYYANIAELALNYAPSFGSVTLNGGADITLTPGATTTVYATGTVTDLNGYADLLYASTTIYRSGAGAACTADSNNCYIATTGSTCNFTACADNECILSCAVDLYYHADPTDSGTYEGQEWLAYLEVMDQSSLTDLASAPGVELLTLRALEVNSLIDYGSLEVAENTGSTNATTTIENLGNDSIDVQIVGSDLSDGGSSLIPANQQIFATSTFSYATCVSCTALDTDPINYEIDLAKPTAPTPLTTDSIYWGIEVPFGVASNPYTGNNTFYAIGD